ncbi:hypothetical protein [Streptomyces sp. KR80]|uniref:hypothetical protein n=1 Tax=Streptomyces sp. KR80 TaxID=3457426 RepID=UPI003FD32B03
MDNLVYLLPALACPVGMGLMMWLMMRGKRPATGQPPHTAPGTAQEQELARLRQEVEALRGERTPEANADLHKRSSP